jgi:hypothetical protein
MLRRLEFLNLYVQTLNTALVCNVEIIVILAINRFAQAEVLEIAQATGIGQVVTRGLVYPGQHHNALAQMANQLECRLAIMEFGAHARIVHRDK